MFKNKQEEADKIRNLTICFNVTNKATMKKFDYMSLTVFRLCDNSNCVSSLHITLYKTGQIKAVTGVLLLKRPLSACRYTYQLLLMRKPGQNSQTIYSDSNPESSKKIIPLL